MKDRRLLFIINNLGVGGAEHVFVRDANVLTEKGYEVYFAVLFGGDAEQILLSQLKIPKERMFYCQASSLFDMRGLVRLKKFIQENNIRITFSTLNEANIWNRLLKVFLTPVRVIVREANVADIKPFKFKIIDLLLYPFTYKIAAVSQGVKKSLKYLPQRKIVVLENGVDIFGTTSQLRDDITTPKLIFVGSLTPKKDIPFLIEGMRKLKDNGRDFTLNIIGDGIERERIEDLLKRYGLAKQVQLSGKLPAEEAKKYYMTADVFILPSRFEGSPNVLLEALSYNIPVITSDFLGASDIIEDKKNGLIVPQGNALKLAEAIEFYMDHNGERKKIAMAGLELVKLRYSVDTHVNNLISILGL